MWLDIAGTGSHVGDGFEEGDQVVAFLPPDARESGFGDFCIVSSCWAHKIPAGVAPRECAAVLRAGIQAFTALHYQARLTVGLALRRYGSYNVFLLLLFSPSTVGLCERPQPIL
jgi:NADPH:quinone reductase-like Zn-dependent oxidoreductase